MVENCGEGGEGACPKCFVATSPHLPSSSSLKLLLQGVVKRRRRGWILLPRKGEKEEEEGRSVQTSLTAANKGGE